MKIFEHTYERITNSMAFKKFKQENPSIKLCAGFFILDFLSNDTKRSLDYLDENSKKIFTFELNDKDEINFKKDKLIQTEIPPKLKLTPLQQKIPEEKPQVSVELEELEEIINKEKLERKISAKIHKIIAVLQNYEKKLIWNLTCMLDQLIILQVLIDAKDGKIIKFERKNIMDFIKNHKNK